VSCTDATDCTAVGQDFNGQPFYATSVAAQPSLSLLKVANGGTGVAIPVGSPVSFTYQVTNSGNVTLSDVTVTDTKVPSASIDCGGGTNVIASMAPKAEVTCSATATATQGKIFSRGTASGTPPSGPAASATSLTNYVGFTARIRLAMQTNGQNFAHPPVGHVVNWTYTVTNWGSKYAPLTAVTVTDSVLGSAIDCGGGTNVIPSLNPGASVVCRATGTAASGPYQSTGTVSATPPAGPAVTASAHSGYYGR
jgi:hypothetical protein